MLVAQVQWQQVMDAYNAFTKRALQLAATAAEKGFISRRLDEIGI